MQNNGTGRNLPLPFSDFENLRTARDIPRERTAVRTSIVAHVPMEKSITSATSRQSTILLALFPLPGTQSLLSLRADSVQADESISQVFEVHPETVASARVFQYRARQVARHTSTRVFPRTGMTRWRSSGTGISRDLGRAQFCYENRIIFQSDPRLYNGHWVSAS